MERGEPGSAPVRFFPPVQPSHFGSMILRVRRAQDIRERCCPGYVVCIMEEGKVTMRTSDGTVHEFQASKETLQELKAGDRIAAKLRNAPNC